MKTICSVVAIAALSSAAVISSGEAIQASAASVSEIEAPKRFAPEALSQDGRITFTPAISPDGQQLFFTQADCKLIWECPQELYRAQRQGHGWSTPEKVGFSAGERVEWPSFSPDGKTLLFSWATDRERHRGLDIYEDFDLFKIDLSRPDAAPEATVRTSAVRI